MEPGALDGGFTDAPRQAAQAFRAIMTAMARPGQIESLKGATPPAPLSVAAGTALLTLCDADTPLYLAGAADCPALRAWIAFHIGAPLSGPESCQFALGSWDALLPLDPYPIGTPDYPDRSATLIVELPQLAAEGVRLTGPGIKDSAALTLPDPRILAQNAARFPLGLDCLFTCDRRIAALPRSTRIAAPAEEAL